MHANAFLKSPNSFSGSPLAALWGAERFFKPKIIQALIDHWLGGEDAELGLVKLPASTDWTTVSDEVRTVSMFGNRRLVVIEDADEFVKNNRSHLEKYLEKPSRKSLLVLDVKTWPSSTRLAKKVAELKGDIECTAPKPREVGRWVVDYCQQAYDRQITQDAAQTLVELAGTELGQLDQELAKLAAYVGEKKRIDAAAVTKLVGGWKAETTWSMLDAVKAGQLGQALHLLDKLLTAGEHPLMLMGGINYTFRPLARATEASRMGQPLGNALSDAGVRPQGIEAAQSYLKRIGRPRAEQFLSWLSAADRELKGASQLPERMIMERLLTQLAGKLPV